MFRDSFFFFPETFSLVRSAQRKHLRGLTCSGGWVVGEVLKKGFQIQAQTDYFNGFRLVTEVRR